MNTTSSSVGRIGLAALLALVLTACSWITGTTLKDQTVTAACGLCVFHQDAPGCYWAIEVDGAYYAVNGPLPQHHDAHGPEGMCRMPRQAVVSGKLRGGQFYADRFDLLPVDPAAVPKELAAPEHVHGPR